MERYLRDADKFAGQWLREYQRENPEGGANGYRILDERGARLKASASATASFFSDPI